MNDNVPHTNTHVTPAATCQRGDKWRAKERKNSNFFCLPRRKTWLAKKRRRRVGRTQRYRMTHAFSMTWAAVWSPDANMCSRKCVIRVVIFESPYATLWVHVLHLYMLPGSVVLLMIDATFYASAVSETWRRHLLPVRIYTATDALTLQYISTLYETNF